MINIKYKFQLLVYEDKIDIFSIVVQLTQFTY